MYISDVPEINFGADAVFANDMAVGNILRVAVDIL